MASSVDLIGNRDTEAASARRRGSARSVTDFIMTIKLLFRGKLSGVDFGTSYKEFLACGFLFLPVGGGGSRIAGCCSGPPRPSLASSWVFPVMDDWLKQPETLSAPAPAERRCQRRVCSAM